MNVYGVAVAILFALAISVVSLWKIFHSEKARDNNPWGWMLGLFLYQTAVLALMDGTWDKCPVRNISEVLFLMGWSLNFFYLIMGRLYRMSIVGTFTAPAIACCLIASLATIRRPDMAVHNTYLTWHITLAMMAYGALGLSAVGGSIFLMQDSFLKGHKLMGISKKLPPVRTLQISMKRLLGVGLLLLMASQFFAWKSGLPITSLKFAVAACISLCYLALTIIVFCKGMPGRRMSWCALGMYLLALVIFFVLK